MASRAGAAPARGPGPKNPGKYPFTGNNYAQYGEQPGYIYWPWTDQYYIDPNAAQGYLQDSGAIKKPEGPPSLASQLGPVAGVALAGGLGYSIARDPGAFVESVSSIPGKISNAFNGAATTAPTAATVGSQTAAQVSAAAPSAATAAAPAAAALAPSAAGSAVGSVGPFGALAGPGGLPVGTAAGPATPQLASVTRVPGEAASIGSGFDYGQGAAGALQAAGGLYQLSQGDKVGGTLNIGAGATNIAAAGQNATAMSVAPWLSGAAGLYTGYQTAKMIGDSPYGGRRNSNAALGGAAAGAGIGTAIAPGIGTAIGAGAGALIGLAGSLFGSDKDKYQMIRDKARSNWKQAGVIDENYQGTLADGSKFDFGKDGKKYGKLNESDPNWGQIAALANVIASGEGATGKGREGIATLYTNAALSNSGGDINKAVANIRHFAQQRGMDPNNIAQVLQKLKEEGQISDQEYAVYNADINKIFGGMTLQNTQAPQAAPQPQQNQGLMYLGQQAQPPTNMQVKPMPRPIAQPGRR